MRYSLAALALAGAAAAVAVPVQSAAPAGPSCKSTYPGTFEIEVVNVTSTPKRDLEKRAALMLTLSDGTLKDAQGRIGYIASNRQFQFDAKSQPGSIYNGGWAVCSNNTLVLGPDAVFQQCLSGTFYNLYDESTAAQCSPVNIFVVGGSSGSQSQAADGQVTGTPVASQQSDGQVTASPGASPIQQISDGQIQMPTGRPVTQITDGQIQVSTSKAAAPVSQISDGQIQAPTTAAAQATTVPAAPKVSQISDGQIQVPTNGTRTSSARPTASVQAYTGAAVALPAIRSELFGLAAGVLAVAML